MRPAESPGASLFQSAETLCGVRFVPQKKTASGGLSRYGYQEHNDKNGAGMYEQISPVPRGLVCYQKFSCFLIGPVDYFRGSTAVEEFVETDIQRLEQFPG